MSLYIFVFYFFYTVPFPNTIGLVEIKVGSALFFQPSLIPIFYCERKKKRPFKRCECT